MEAMLVAGIDYDLFFYNPTFIRSKNTKSESKKISALHLTMASNSSTPITMLTIGLPALRA
jgi:hypothetical protein